MILDGIRQLTEGNAMIARANESWAKLLKGDVEDENKTWEWRMVEGSVKTDPWTTPVFSETIVIFGPQDVVKMPKEIRKAHYFVD